MKHEPASEDQSTPTILKLKPSFWPKVIKGFFLILLILVIAGLTAPMVIRCPKKSDQTEAVNNARQIGLALFEFMETYGRMPDANTNDLTRHESSTEVKLDGKTSNDFLRQLMATGIVQSEQMFYARIAQSRKPDGILTGTTALAKRECGFTYLLGARLESKSNRPLLVTPMIPGTDRFDPEPFKGKAVVLKMDNSVTSLPISSKTGHVILDGRNLMDPTHPVWEGNPPVIAWPDL